MKSIVETTEKRDGVTLEIAVRGEFDFSLHESFLCSWRSRPSYSKYLVDLTRCDDLQSCAFGMLMLLSEEVGDRAVLIIEENSSVDALLGLVRFDEVFEIVKRPGKRKL